MAEPIQEKNPGRKENKRGKNEKKKAWKNGDGGFRNLYGDYDFRL